MNDKWTWRKENNLAILQEEGRNTEAEYNEQSLRRALTNVLTSKNMYASHDTWQRQIKKLSDGLDLFLNSRQLK